MIASKVIEKEIETQQRIISRLKREIFGVDKTRKSRYIKEFNSEFRSFHAICDIDEVVEKAAGCDIVYFGDYHPLDASQDFVLRLMEELSERGRKVVLALEMLYVHQQESLDRWMKGRMGEKEFLEKIEYRSEWGFSWESYRRIFELAKDPFIPVFGIDSEPRDHLKYIRRRDRLAAQRIGTIRRFFPGHCVLVVVGESHLASNHLPEEVRRVVGAPQREIVIVQNIDDIYWLLMRKAREDAEAVRVDGNRYCVITASPMLKYRTYRELIDVWVDGEEVDSNTPFLHEMIEGILSFFLKGKKKPMVTIREGRREPLDAVLPEVQGRTTYHAFSSYLRSRKVSPRGSVFALERLKTAGLVYVPEINTFLIMRFDPVRAVEEAARFVLHLMRGDVWARRGKSPAAADDFYGAVIAEALICFGAKVVNPARECMRENALLETLDSKGPARRPLPRYTVRETRELAHMIKQLIERESNGKNALRMTRPFRRIMRLGIKKRILLAQALGARLGEGLHHAYREGSIKEREIIDLFRTRHEGQGGAADLYHGLVEKAGPRSLNVR